ncbi:ArsR/SmtB family transcription factor [Ornithinimicrobium tianjinense]|uniref:Transcriptional regulator, ArsR family protein n=1 Tax=Ornithinimicrobium tianjinense TaxID=1195761 RepID=A0A917BVH2_9MICO|nr:metalloregulator ArsR/SmtB family transcription factor [Ornithinimicrobium tianjinense]GGF58405.1 putative transcriptional regulator, ArsR family protein [Ornithinimicrobium tianjinense]
MDVFECVAEPVRRRLLEHLAASGDLTAGTLVSLAREEFAISQPAVSQHLRVLREAGLVDVRPEGARRVYTLRTAPLTDAEQWLASLRDIWSQRLDALGTELARGRRDRRRATARGERARHTHEEPRRMA